jgi:hypothetical protein
LIRSKSMIKRLSLPCKIKRVPLRSLTMDENELVHGRFEVEEHLENLPQSKGELVNVLDQMQ